MVRAQDVADLGDRLVRVGFAQRRADDLLQVRDGEDALLHRRVGGHDQVVLVHAHAVVALAFEHADDPEGDRTEADDTPHGVFAGGKEFVDDRLAYQTHLGGRLDLLLGEGIAVGDLVAADLQVVEVHAVDRRGRVVGAVDRLSGAVDRRRDVGDVAGLFADVLHIFEFERLHVVGVEPDAAPHVAARMDHDHVGPHFADLGLNAPLRSLPDGEHRDDRRHADDDAEHRQKSAQFVVSERLDGYFEEIREIHVQSSCSGS